MMCTNAPIQEEGTQKEADDGEPFEQAYGRDDAEQHVRGGETGFHECPPRYRSDFGAQDPVTRCTRVTLNSGGPMLPVPGRLPP